jgi:hypothetical protein
VSTLTLDEFAAYVEDYPGLSTSFWGDGSAIAMYPMLAWLNTQPVVLQ